MANSDWSTTDRTYPRRKAAERFYEYCKRSMFPERAADGGFVAPAVWLNQASLAVGDDKCRVHMTVYLSGSSQAIYHTVADPAEMRDVLVRYGIGVKPELNALAEECLQGEKQ